jgi:hypothetical protein
VNIKLETYLYALAEKGRCLAQFGYGAQIKIKRPNLFILTLAILPSRRPERETRDCMVCLPQVPFFRHNNEIMDVLRIS